MVQCWRKSRNLGLEPGLAPHCPPWALHEVSMERTCYNKRRSQCV